MSSIKYLNNVMKYNLKFRIKIDYLRKYLITLNLIN